MFAFDLLFVDKQDLRRQPLIERRDKIRRLIPVDTRSAIQFSDHYDGQGAELFKQACTMGLEGILSKRALSPYKSGPSKFWLRTKNVVERELILLGTNYDKDGKPIAYLGREADGQLQFAGTAFLTLGGGADVIHVTFAPLTALHLGQAHHFGSPRFKRPYKV